MLQGRVDMIHMHVSLSQCKYGTLASRLIVINHWLFQPKSISTSNKNEFKKCFFIQLWRWFLLLLAHNFIVVCIIFVLCIFLVFSISIVIIIITFLFYALIGGTGIIVATISVLHSLWCSSFFFFHWFLYYCCNLYYCKII